MSWTLLTSTSSQALLKPTVLPGANVYAVPQRNSNWTAAYPAQTSLTAFNTTAEAFSALLHWSSSELSGTNSYVLLFTTAAKLVATKHAKRQRVAFVPSAASRCNAR
jgi:hypothetical protein